MNNTAAIAILATFILCEYYNRRIIRAIKGQPLSMRISKWKNDPKAASRIPAQKTALNARRYATANAKDTQNTHYIDA